jgi:hypothetical protein
VIDNSHGRRQFGRRKAFKAATLALPGGERVAATVVDLSEAGARIKIADPQTVGEEFYIEIPGDDFVVKCRVIHRQETTIGVEFTKPPRRLSWLNK